MFYTHWCDVNPGYMAKWSREPGGAILLGVMLTASARHACDADLDHVQWENMRYVSLSLYLTVEKTRPFWIRDCPLGLCPFAGLYLVFLLLLPNSIEYDPFFFSFFLPQTYRNVQITVRHSPRYLTTRY
ncbi:hypothetical protein BT67DRAFT_160043 [Trichocladium antarcticum]|uniref:Uncharacterized protein n=1 Tax=Trichocladium antarcticum TaxID=1450529 RepID=A0AAN6ZAW2_9PEZI|nr:hypothetical protein BT67DRAFT_160043 [Trichocladium antarcticum]